MLDGWRYTPIIDSPQREATDEINHKFKRCGDCLCKWPQQLLPLLAYDLAAQYVWEKKMRNIKKKGKEGLEHFVNGQSRDPCHRTKHR